MKLLNNHQNALIEVHLLNGWQSRAYLVNQGHWDRPVSVGRYGTFPFIDPLLVKIANALLTGPTEQSKLVVRFAQQTTSLRRVVGAEYSKLLGTSLCKLHSK